MAANDVDGDRQRHNLRDRRDTAGMTEPRPNDALAAQIEEHHGH
jgi:hypothetical protein